MNEIHEIKTAAQMSDEQLVKEFESESQLAGATRCTRLACDALRSELLRRLLPRNSATKKIVFIKNHVVAAVIKDSAKRVYIQQRPIEKEWGGMWELPGGKVNTGETLDHAIIREIREEIANITIVPVRLIASVQKTNRQLGMYLLHFIECLSPYLGKIRPIECERFAWIDKTNVHQFQLIKEDKLFLLEEVLV